MVSGMRGTVPFTQNDEELLTDLPQGEQKAVLNWIAENILPIKSANYRSSSYGLKHMLTRDTGIYLTNNQFKHAMALSGYLPVDQHMRNWHYRISAKSPCFQAK